MISPGLGMYLLFLSSSLLLSRELATRESWNEVTQTSVLESVELNQIVRRTQRVVSPYFLPKNTSTLSLSTLLYPLSNCSLQYQAGNQRLSLRSSADTFSRIIIWGGGIFAPAVTGWFGALQRIPIQSKWPAALAKTGLDQFAFAPIAISGMSPSRPITSILDSSPQ